MQLLKVDYAHTFTFTGEILEAYPARINDVIRIILLDDEKMKNKDCVEKKDI